MDCTLLKLSYVKMYIYFNMKKYLVWKQTRRQKKNMVVCGMVLSNKGFQKEI